MDSAVIIAVISLISSALVAWITLRGNRAVKREEAMLPPYDELAKRVATLERQQGELIAEREVDRAYIRRLLPAWQDLPRPLPAWLVRERDPWHPETPGSIIEPTQKDSPQ